METAQLPGRVALVTGASGGIGGAVARRLATLGLHLALTFHSTSCEKLATELTSQYPSLQIRSYQCDMSDADQITKLVDAVERDFGQTIGVLIANAGRGIRASLLDLTLEEFDKTHAVNIRAPFLIAKLAVPKMVAEKFGRIVFVGSVAGFTGGVVGPHYASSKSALHGLSHSIASNFAAHGITSNVVAPALIEDTTMLPGDPGDLAKRIPVGRLGKPDEVAGIVSMMVTTGYLTNQTVLVDGGLYPT